MISFLVYKATISPLSEIGENPSFAFCNKYGLKAARRAPQFSKR